MVSGTYQTSGSTLSCPTGTTGQLVTLNLIGGGGGNASATVALTGAGAIANGTPLRIISPGSGYTAGPTAGSPVSYASYVPCTGTAAVSTTIGTAYTVFDTLTLSSTTAGATATATWGTSVLGSSLNVGDAVAAFNGWYGIAGSVASAQSYVKQVGPCSGGACTAGCSSLTSSQACVINNNAVTASSSTPQMAWRFPQWSGTDAGRVWATKHQGSNSYGVTGALYGAGVNSNISNNYIGDTATNGGGACPACVLAFDLSTVLDDTRAQRDLTRIQTFLFDYGLRSDMDVITGRGRFGTGYSKDTETPQDELTVWPLTQTIPSYPHLHIDTGPWGQSPPLYWIFSTLPDNQASQYNFMAEQITSYQEYSYGNTGEASIGTAFMPSFWWQPTSNNSQWLMYWLNHAPSQSAGGWGRTENYLQALAVLHNDPRVTASPSLPFPAQYGFFPNSSPTMTADTGWSSVYNGGNAVISRGKPFGSDGSLALFDASTNTGANAYDNPRVGELCVWYDGPLLCTDSNPSGDASGDPSIIGDIFQFNAAAGYNAFVTGIAPNSIGPTPITAWASANAGSYGPQFGDQASRYAYACASTLPNYNQTYLSLSIRVANQCFVHHKYSSHDEFILEFHDYELNSGSAAMAWHLQYPQNGQTQNGGNFNPTGSTTLSGGVITSKQASGFGTHGLQTAVMSPNTITLHDDCVGLASGQCSPSATYTGGNGYTHRFTVAGGASVGAAVSKFQTVTCHKVMGSASGGLSDTTFSAVGLNPDANWTGAACTGAHSTGVYVQSLGGVTRSIMTGFTVSSSLPVDWIIGGLTPGNYTLTLGGTPIFSGAVNAGDGTIYANSANGGTVALSNSLSSPPSSGTALSGNVKVTGNVVIH